MSAEFSYDLCADVLSLLYFLTQMIDTLHLRVLYEIVQ